MQPTSTKARLDELMDERETLRIRLSIMRSGETYPSDETSIAAAATRLGFVEEMIPALRSEIMRDDTGRSKVASPGAA